MDSTGSSADAGQAHAADGEEDDIWQGALEAAGVEDAKRDRKIIGIRALKITSTSTERQKT